MQRRCGVGVLLSLLAMGLGSVASAEPLHVVATTTLVGDVVRSIAGALVRLDVLFPVGADPHAFQPTPRDAVAVAGAEIVFISGGGLEASIADLLANAAGSVVDLFEELHAVGLVLDGAETDEDGAHDHDHDGADPHVWLDPNLVAIWVDAIEAALAERDPANATAYAAAASEYRAALAELDVWIRDRVDVLPPERRRLVTDHMAFGYFAARYGFEQVGSVFPGFSTLAEPSAREMADLVETIRSLDVSAIFVGAAVNPTLAEAIALDAGAVVVRLYTGSLSDAAGPAADYFSLIRYDVEAIVEALSTRGEQE